MNRGWGLALAVAFLAFSFKSCLCQNVSTDAGWAPAGVTWYGDPNGAGSTGGACGYGDTVARRPFNAIVAAGGPSFFRKGQGCGTCFQLMCHGGGCSGRPVTVVITDECPGGPCASEPAHFDLSGRAIGALAAPGSDGQLRAAGVLKVQYRRVPCNYGRVHVAFRIDPGANPFYMSFVVQYTNGDGDLAAVELQPAGGNWIRMQQMRSAVWKLNSGGALRGPFNVRLTSAVSHKVVVAQNVIPANWRAGGTYWSAVNF